MSLHLRNFKDNFIIHYYHYRMKNIKAFIKLFWFGLVLIGILLLGLNLSFSAKPTTTVDQSIWSAIGANLNLDHHTQNPRVQQEIRHILRDKKSFVTILNHSRPYLYYIYSQTQKDHLPAELTLIPVIESEYNPNDHEPNGAYGLWQLMPATARILKVKMSNGFDGRHDTVASTKAALTFFRDLNTQFKGNWNLAIAAYNCGPGCVASAVRRSDSTNYFNLSLPLETKIYVPRLLAIAAIVKDPQKYGVTLPPIKNGPYLGNLPVKKSVSLASNVKSHGRSKQH